MSIIPEQDMHAVSNLESPLWVAGGRLGEMRGSDRDAHADEKAGTGQTQMSLISPAPGEEQKRICLIGKFVPLR